MRIYLRGGQGAIRLLKHNVENNIADRLQREALSLVHNWSTFNHQRLTVTFAAYTEYSVSV